MRGKGEVVMRRLPWVLALAAVLVMAVAVPAGADPKAETFELTCEGVPSGTITANSGLGLWTPGFAVDGTGVYIPYKLVYEAWFTPEGGEEVYIGAEIFEKKAPNNTKPHDHGVCTFSGEEELVDDPDFGTGLLRFGAEAHVFWTGG
jgi:hypothetical protein